MKNQDQILKELKSEINETLYWLVEMDIKMYGYIKPSILEAFKAQEVEFPTDLLPLLEGRNEENIKAIYKSVHKDYKGKSNGKLSILYLDNDGATTSGAIETMPENIFQKYLAKVL